MEPINNMQQPQKKKENAPFPNAPADQITTKQITDGPQQSELQLQRNGADIQKEKSIMEQFSKRVPSYSLELQKKLLDGPPPEFGKFQKIRWTSDMNQKIQAQKHLESDRIHQQARFFAPSEQLLDDMVRKKSTLPENADVMQIAAILTDTLANADAVDTQRLIPDTAVLSPEITALKDLFTELSAFSPKSFTQKQAKEFTARYHSLGMEVSASASRYLDEAGTMDPASCYVILRHCAALMLQYHLDTLGTDKVNTTEYSKLCALAAVTGFAANTIVLSQDYQNRRQTHLLQLTEKAVKEKQEARGREMFQASRKQYLYTGTSAEGKAEIWPLAPYANLAETILSEKLYTLSDKDLGLMIQRMEENLESNTSAVRIFYQEQMKKKPELEGFKEEAIPKILLYLGESLLNDRLEISSALILDAMTKFTEEYADRLTLYKNRLEQLKNMPPLDLLSDDLSCTEITDMICRQNTPEAFDAAAALLQKQAQKNIDIAKALISEKITDNNRSAAMEFLIGRIGSLLLLGAPVVVFTETEYLLDYLDQFAPQIAYAENVLKRKQKQNDSLTIKEYRNERTNETPITLKKSDISNVQLLRGDDLCTWSGFDGFLKGEEDAVMDTLSQALREKLLPLPCLKNILTLQDLELLPLQDFTSFLTLLRSNIGKGLTEWKNIASPYPKEIQKRLLKELICGKLTSENIPARIAQEEARLEKQAKAQRLRFLSFLGADTPSAGEVRYLRLKDRAATAMTGEPSRAVRRKKRFQDAENLWKLIGASHFENLLHDIWISAQGNEAPFAFIRQKLTERINELKTSIETTKKPLYEEIDELTDLLAKFPIYTPPFTNKADNFEREFMLKGMEDELLSFQEAFTVQENADYRNTLLNLEKIIIPRYTQLDQILKKAFPNDPSQVKSYHDKAKKLLTGLKPLDDSRPTKEQQERNRALFGVSDWEEALTEIKKLISPADPSLIQQARQAAALLKKREEQLIGYKDGVLKPFCSLILQDQDAFQILITGEEDGIPQYLSALERQFRNPYEALKRYNPYGIFAQEFIIEKKELFRSQKNASLDFWKAETESYYRAYCSYEIKKGISIDKRYQELSESDPVLAPYLMQIIFSDANGISMLDSSGKKNLSKKLAAFKTQIEANNSSLDSFSENLPQVKNSALLTGFRLYLQTKIPFTKTEVFKANLLTWWEDFQKLDVLTQKETKKSTQILSKRAQTMILIESKKQRGIEADRADQELLKQIQDQAKYGFSPILLALGHKKLPDSGTYSEKKRELSEKYKKLPDIIQDILLESSLLETSPEELKKEASWLASAYETITATGFVIGSSSIFLDGDPAKELLMTVFTKWKTTGKEITPRALQDAFLSLADCHRLLQELTDIPLQDAGLLMERDHLAETFAAGMYLMEKKDFEALLTRKISYLKASSLALKVFWEETAGFDKEQAALCSGLREYFHEDLLKDDKALDLPALRKQTKEFLANEPIRQFLKNSSSLMEQISSTDEIKLTSSHHTLAQKSDLESYLSSLPDHSAFRSYAQLNLAQRQIFAMALGAPGQEELYLPTARFLKNEKLSNAFRIQMQEQLYQYISHHTFTPVVNYTSALSQLKNPDGSIRKEAFQRAMNFTNAVISQRLQNTPVDWDRLSDSTSAYIAAAKLKGDTADPEQLAVTDSEEFLQKLSNADQESARASKLKQNLHSLTRHQLQLLVHVLADRTILDRSTKLTARDRAQGALHAYANTEKRAELMHLLIHDPSIAAKNALSSQVLSAAMASLMSYQLRDDITLTGESLKKNDFAPHALDRKTVIDWDLLSEALFFVHETEQETLRLNAVRQADVLIPESRNEAAIEEYQIQRKAVLSTQEDFENYLQTQAKKDGMAALYAGYKQLDIPERALFIKVLTKRHLLDISKKDIHLNRLGLAERRYADEQGRNELLNEYMEASLTKNGTVALDENAYRQAVYMTLSAQISDDVDFTKMKDKSLASCLTSFSNPFKSVRSTAVDWKLVQRALQFVHRAGNEKDIFHQDRELYVSQGNLLATGHFTFDAAHLRKNIHNSGSRFGRYLCRRIQDDLLEQIPDYLKPILRQAVAMSREQLSAARSDQLNKLGIFSNSEKENSPRQIFALMKWEKEFYQDFWKSSEKEMLKKEVSEETSHRQNREQKELTEETSRRQTREQKELSEKAIDRNLNMQKQGYAKSRERLTDTIIDTLSKIIGSTAVEDELLETAVTEAGKLINFIRNYLNDKSSVVKFFQANGELEKMRTAYQNIEWKNEQKVLSDIELIRQMKGYENYTELADFVGLNITRSLLFCAGKYNPQEKLRYLAAAALASINMTDAIGQQDAETAKRVFHALMGSEYR